MEIKILQVFLGADGLPYKDQERTIHFPIVGSGFQGASNTTKIRFYYDELVEEDDTETAWVACAKLPNGKIGSKVLETDYDSTLGEHYALLELDSFYFQYKGDVYISLQGYQGGVQVSYNEETELYTIYGTPTIAATGSIKLSVNYATQFVGSGETSNVNFQRILADLGTKLGIRATSVFVEELPAVGENDTFYAINNDPDDPHLTNIYVWNGNTEQYVWVGNNTLDIQPIENKINDLNDRIDNLTVAYNYKGSRTVAQINALTNQSAGDVYNVTDSGTITTGSVSVVAGDNVAWTGTAWDKLAGTVDLSGYTQKYEFNEVKSLFVLSPNVYNEQSEIIKYTYASGGVVTYNVNYKINLDFIPVEYGDYISFYGNNTTNKDGVQNICLYDADKTYLSRHSFENVGLTSFQIANANAKYVRICVGINATNVMVVIDKAQPSYATLTYVKYGKYLINEAVPKNAALKEETEPVINLFEFSRNVYDPTKEQANTVLGSSGVETYNTSYKINTEYIEIETDDYVTFYGNGVEGGGIQNFVIYDENKQYIARYQFTSNLLVTQQIELVGVKYIRFSAAANAKNIMVVIDKKGSTPSYQSLTYVPYGYNHIKKSALPSDVLEDIEELKDIADELDYDYKYINLTDNLETFSAAYLNNSHEIISSSVWIAKKLLVTDLPESFNQISVKSYTNLTSRYQVAFYSNATPSDATYIDGIKFTVGSSLNEAIITSIPTGTVSILITNLIASGDISVVLRTNKQTIVTEIKENVDELDALELREQRAKFDLQFNYIAYSAMMVSGAGPNSEAQYLWGAQRKFTALKGDVRISSDNEIVMCHDAGFTLNASGYVTSYDSSNNTKIRDMTAAQCFALIYENTNDHVCGIDALIRTCKLYGKIPYITIRDAYTNDILPKLFASLDKYNMREKAIINSFTYDVLKIVRKYDKHIMLSWVQTYNHQLTTQDIDKANALGNCLITCYDYSGTNPTTAANQSNEVIAYAKQKDIRLYEAQIVRDQDLNADVLYDRGFTGAQIVFEPSIFSTMS